MIPILVIFLARAVGKAPGERFEYVDKHARGAAGRALACIGVLCAFFVLDGAVRGARAEVYVGGFICAARFSENGE